MVPGSHLDGLAAHCPGTGPDGGLQIPAKLIKREAIPVPIKRGGVLFMQRRTMHAALENVSDEEISKAVSKEGKVLVCQRLAETRSKGWLSFTFRKLGVTHSKRNEKVDTPHPASPCSSP